MVVGMGFSKSQDAPVEVNKHVAGVPYQKSDAAENVFLTNGSSPASGPGSARATEAAGLTATTG
jgi:hypothetical protein